MAEIIDFKLVSKTDSRIYLNGSWDITDYNEDTNTDNWEYEQNDGTFQSHIPSYWKVDGENLSFEFAQFIDSIDWDMFRQYLWDFKDEARSVDCGDYFLHINYGACVEVEVILDDDFDRFFMGTVKFTYNGKPMELDEDIQRDLGESLLFDDGDMGIMKPNCSFHFQLPKTFSDYYDGDEEMNSEIINEFHQEGCKYYARQLTRDAGIYSTYGEFMEQCVEDGISFDRSDMFAFKCAVEDDTVEKFLLDHDYSISEE